MCAASVSVPAKAPVAFSIEGLNPGSVPDAAEGEGFKERAWNERGSPKVTSDSMPLITRLSLCRPDRDEYRKSLKCQVMRHSYEPIAVRTDDTDFTTAGGCAVYTAHIGHRDPPS